jgi:hypothetical protein
MPEHFVAPVAGIDLDGVTTDQRFQLGTIVCGSDSSGSYSAEYMYVRANGAVAQYACGEIDATYDFTDLSSSDVTAGTEPMMAGVAQVAFADNEFGWVVISGSGTVLCTTGGSAAADVRMYLTISDGILDDVVLTNACVEGLKLTAANATNQAAFLAVQRLQLNVDDAEAN